MERSGFIISLAFANLSGFIAVLTVNALANIIPINGMGTGEISDLYPNLFVPAGLTFSIWGLIYLLLACFSIYGLTSAFRNNIDSSFLIRVNIWFTVTNLANIAWIFAWHWKKTGLSLLFMIILLAGLIIIYLRLDTDESLTKKTAFFTRLPFSIYLGWITVATIANVTALLVSRNWNGFGISGTVWTVLVISAAVIIACIIIFTRKDLAFGLVIIWALAGIMLKRNTAGDAPAIGISAIAAITVIAAVYVLKSLITLNRGY